MLPCFKLTALAVAMLAMPVSAFAQSGASSRIELSSTVTRACGMGSPTLTVLDLHELSGPDGRLDASKRSSTTQASTVIADTWCNAPNSLKLDAKPMSLQEARSYAQPTYMAREITYDAKLVGWGPFTFVRRPKSGDDGEAFEMNQPYSASSPGLTLNISRLETLTAAKAEDSTLMLEAGHYKGTVTITLTPLS